MSVIKIKPDGVIGIDHKDIAFIYKYGIVIYCLYGSYIYIYIHIRHIPTHSYSVFCDLLILLCSHANMRLCNY